MFLVSFSPAPGLDWCAGLSAVAVGGAALCSRRAGCSLWRLLSRSVDCGVEVLSGCSSWLSSFGPEAAEHGPTSFTAQAQLLRGMCDLPGPEIKPVSPALAGSGKAETPGKLFSSVQSLSRV